MSSSSSSPPPEEADESLIALATASKPKAPKRKASFRPNPSRVARRTNHSTADTTDASAASCAETGLTALAQAAASDPAEAPSTSQDSSSGEKDARKSPSPETHNNLATNNTSTETRTDPASEESAKSAEKQDLPVTPRSPRRRKGATPIQASDPSVPSGGGSTVRMETALVTTRSKRNQDLTPLSGQPRLKQFCSAYRCKPRQGAAAPAPPPPPPAPEEDVVAPAAPVVRLVDGKIVLQESSMEVSGNKTTHQQAIEEEFDVVEEEAQLGGIGSTYSSFRKQNRPYHWTVAETKKFYQALRQVGQDFGTMEFFFDNPPRNRKSLKQKFRQESIRNPALIEAALNPKARQKLDLEVFSVEVDEEALKKSREEREKAYEKTKKAHEERQRKEAEAQKRADHAEEDVEETPVEVVNHGVGAQNSPFFDDTSQFWDEAATHEGAEEVLGGDLETGNEGLAGAALSREEEYGSVGLSLSPSKSRKKKKSFFRARQKRPVM